MTTPEIVTVCGSMTLFDRMVQVAAEESVRGVIVQLPVPVPNAVDHKTVLDLLHRQRIDRSHRVIVVTAKRRVGEATTGGITYAKAVQIPIEYRDFEEGQ